MEGSAKDKTEKVDMKNETEIKGKDGHPLINQHHLGRKGVQSFATVKLGFEAILSRFNELRRLHITSGLNLTSKYTIYFRKICRQNNNF